MEVAELDCVRRISFDNLLNNSVFFYAALVVTELLCPFWLESFSLPSGNRNFWGPFRTSSLTVCSMMQVQDGQKIAEADKREVHPRKSVPRLVSQSEGSHLVFRPPDGKVCPVLVFGS